MPVLTIPRRVDDPFMSAMCHWLLGDMSRSTVTVGGHLNELVSCMLSSVKLGYVLG